MFGVKIGGFDPFGLTRNLDYIDDIARAAKRAPGLIEQAGRSIVEETKDQVSYLSSGEKFLNNPVKLGLSAGGLLAGGPLGAYGGSKLSDLLKNKTPARDVNVGTDIRNSLRSSPVLGDVLGNTFDSLASPLSLSTLGVGGAPFAGLKGLGGTTARSTLSPVAMGGFKQRLAGEAAAGLGANLGMKGIEQAPLPDEAKLPLGIAAGVLGSGLGASAVNKGFGRTRLPDLNAKPQSRRGYINQELEPHEIAERLGLDKKMVGQLRTAGDRVPDEVRAKLKQMYIDKYDAQPIRGVSRSTASYGEQSVPSPDEDFAYTLEKSLENLGIKPAGPMQSVVPQGGRQQPPEYRFKGQPSFRSMEGFEGTQPRVSGPSSEFDESRKLGAEPVRILPGQGGLSGFEGVESVPNIRASEGVERVSPLTTPTSPVKAPQGNAWTQPTLPDIDPEFYNRLKGAGYSDAQIESIMGTARTQPVLPGIDQEYYRTTLPDVGGTRSGNIEAPPPKKGEQTTLTGFPAPRPRDAATMSKGAWETFNDIMRAFWTPIDISVAFIQGLPMFGSQTKEWGKAMGAALRSSVQPKYFDAWVKALDEKWIAAGKPTIADRVTNGLHLDLPGTVPNTNRVNPLEKGLDKLSSIPIAGIGFVPVRETVKGFNRIFTNGANAMRLLMSDVLIDQANTPGLRAWLGTGTVEGGALAHMPEIMSATNRATGTTNNSMLGRLGDIAFFAPKFLTANIELVIKAFQAGTIDGAIARRQLAKLTVAGIGITELYNYIQGHNTDYDPMSNNFLRMRDVAGADVSMFGYLDTMIRGVALAGKGIAGEAGITIPGQDEAGSYKDALFVLRSKASPAASLAIDLITGKNFAGNSPTELGELARYPLPFSIRDIGREPASAIGLGALGIKASPLTPSEKLDRTLEDEGIVKSDPEYDIKRKQFLADNPQHIPEKKGEFKEAQKITDRTNELKRNLEEDTKSGVIKLEKYRERRKDILDAQRAKLEQLNPDFKKRDTKQAKWIDSYYNLYKLATDKRTDEIDTDKFDRLLLDWKAENGDQAYDYVQRYSQAGKGEVETQYLTDLRTLDNLGYFSMNRYRNLRSGRDPKELQELRDTVEAERSADPRLAKASFSSVAARVLQGMPREVILDVINMGKQAYENPEFTKFKAEHKDLLQWFNPNATWSTYNKAKDIVARTATQRKAS